MPKLERFKTPYPGVFYTVGTAVADGRPERIYYIRYRKGGRVIEEKAGRQYQDDMTPARAGRLRSQRIEGDAPTNQERRQAEAARRRAEESRWTIERIWEEYRSQKQPKGLKQDESRYRRYIAPAFGDKEPCDLVTLDVDRLRLGLAKKSAKSPQTIKHVIALLRRLIRFAVNKGLCSQPEPGRLSFELPRVDNEKTEDLTPEQLTRLLEAIEEDTNRQAADLMKMALFTGMRRGELFRLRWDDLDFERNFILIRGPKGGKDQKIPMNEPARALLESHPKTDSPYVFPGRGGKMRTDVNHQVSRIKERAGLPDDFRALHGLRHVYATMLASSGQVDMYTLQKLLTHKSPIMTQRYAHLRDEAMQRAAALAGEIITTHAGNGEKAEAKVVNIRPEK
jgi:integrase